MLKNLKFFLTYPKIGPDMFLTHWLLYLKITRMWFIKRKIYSIGKNSEIRPFATINGTDSLTIGENVIVQPFSILSSAIGDLGNGIIIENDVLLAPSVSIYSETHQYSNPSIAIKEQGYIKKRVRIKSGAWIGVNCVILPGVTIGKNAVVGANSVVNKDVDDYTVVAGSPAKVIKKLR